MRLLDSGKEVDGDFGLVVDAQSKVSTRSEAKTVRHDVRRTYKASTQDESITLQ